MSDASRGPTDDPPAAPEGDGALPDGRSVRRVVHHTLAPVALLGLGVVVLILALVAIAADSQNRLALEAARHLAGSAMRVETDQVGGFVRDYSFWNDTVENVVVNLDETWASENIGAWVYDNLGMHASLVLNGDLQLIYGTVDGERAGPDLPSRLSPEVADLVAVARSRAGEPGAAPGVATSYLELDGSLVVAAAVAIKWEDERPVPTRAGAPVVLLYARRIDDAMLERVGEFFLLPDTRLVAASTELADSIPLPAMGGRVLARLAWTGERPGTALIREMAIPLAGIAVLAAILMWVIVRRARRSAADLARSHEQLESQTVALKASTAALRSALVEADRANAAKSDFLARMSHELRTPLNAILGFSEIIALELYGAHSDARYREYGRLIHDSGDHLRSLINDILDLAKIEAGRFDLVEEETDLDAITEQCLGLFAPKIEAKALRVDYRPSAIRLVVDARALKQILLNLLSNAVKFTGTGGQIGVRASDGPHGIVITVVDTGCGMSPDDLGHIFQLFGQARGAEIRDGEGSGLGLNIAKGLVEMHGGSLSIESEPGVGTKATVRFDSSRSLPAGSFAATG